MHQLNDHPNDCTVELLHHDERAHLIRDPTLTAINHSSESPTDSASGINSGGRAGTIFDQTFRPKWNYVSPATELIPATKNYAMAVGDQITISPQMLIAGVTDGSGAPADADGVSVKSVPAGAVISPNQTITYTAARAGVVNFTFTLSNSESNITSAVSPGGIVAGEVTPPATSVITPAPQVYSYGLGEPVTLDLPTVTAGSDLSGCTISNGDVCAPDAVVFSNLPAGATIGGSGALIWTPTSAGVYTLDMVLSQSSDGATSPLTPVTITVMTQPKVIPLSQSYTATTSEPLTISLSQLEGSCTIQNATVSCAEAGLNLDSLTPPTGATTTTDGSSSVTAINFTPTAAGTYPFTYRLGEMKNYGFSDLVTSYVVVTDAGMVTPPVVTPPAVEPPVVVPPAVVVPLPMVTG